MINVLIKTESHYKVDRDRMRKTVVVFLKSRGVKGPSEVSINIVGDRFMKKINKKYRNLDATASVLTFSLTDEEPQKPFTAPPDGILHLGDIIISYPQVREYACSENKLVDEKMDDFVIHGLTNLLS